MLNLPFLIGTNSFTLRAHGFSPTRKTGIVPEVSCAQKTLQAMLDTKIDVGLPGELNLRGFRERTVNGETVRGHTGGGRADVVMLWESDYTVIVLTNLSPPPASAFGSEITEFLARSSGK